MARFGALFVMTVMPLMSWAQNGPAPASMSPAAQSTAPSISEEERMRVKKRLYPGGRDEEPLQVQSQLASPTRAAVSPDELPEDETD